MKPSQGLLIVVIGLLITVFSAAPMGVAHFASDAFPNVAVEWGMRTVLLYYGIACLLFGHVVMAIGVIMAGVGVFTKSPVKRF